MEIAFYTFQLCFNLFVVIYILSNRRRNKND